VVPRGRARNAFDGIRLLKGMGAGYAVVTKKLVNSTGVSLFFTKLRTNENAFLATIVAWMKR
jgi:hypothetical protein